VDAHHRLVIWQDARRLVRVVYRATTALPPDERFVAVPQIRRAAWSVHNNIAEGNAKLGRREMRRFLDAAIGSLAEVDAMLTTLRDLSPIDSAAMDEAQGLRRRINAGLFSMLRTRRR
jgi:four helix bundle protein